MSTPGGIAGFYGSGPWNAGPAAQGGGPAGRAPLHALAAALTHRGETEEVQLDGAVGLAGRGASVATAGDGLIAVAAGADAADVLARYQAGGADQFAVLPAPYALALHDPATNTLVLARDGAGIAPLYYAPVGDGVVFASEPAALAAAGVPLAPDDAVVAQFVVTGRSEFGESTFYAGVRKVPSGHALVLGAGGESQDIELVPPAVTDPQAAVADALGTAQRPAVRLGEGLPGAVLAFTAPDAAVLSPNYGPMDAEEGRYLAGVVGALSAGERHRRINVDADTLAADLPEFLRAQGEPVADLGAYVQYAIAKAAAGAGADLLLDPAGGAAAYDLTLPPAAGKKRKPVDPSTLLKNPPASAASVPDEARVAEVRRAADRTGAALGIAIATPYAGAHGDVTALGAPLRPAAGIAAGQGRAPAPARDWLLRLKNRIYGTFLAESFVNRPWFAQQPVLVAFEDFIKGRNNDAALFWRIWCVEMWAQEMFDPKPVADDAPVQVKGPLEANANKQLPIELDGETWLRFPIRTELFMKGDPFEERITSYVTEFVGHAASDPSYLKALSAGPWYLLVSEKIVAISQGRSYFIWDIEPSWWARTLSRFVVKTPYGIGLGSPWTMELAIREAGLPRILLAAGASAGGKAIGKRGVFYNVAGHSVRAIDGPTEYSVYPANVSAKLAPAEPDAVASRLRARVVPALTEAGFEAAAGALAGVVVIDANDIGRNVLGRDADRPAEFFENLFGDNPLGQGSEQTPLAVATRIG